MSPKSQDLKRSKAPAAARHGREEPDYLYHKVLLWFYEHGDRRRTRPFAERLAKAIEQNPAYRGTIFAEECWSLIFESRGDLDKAIKYRRQEIEKIRRLHEITLDTPQRASILKHYDFQDLADRLDLLALLYQEQGNLAKAREVLHESRALARRHRFPFDGKDILREVEEEVVAKQANGAARRNGVKTRPRSIGADLL